MDDQQKQQPPSEAEILKHWEDSWKTEDAKLSTPHNRKEYTFTKKELRALLQQGTIELMAERTMEIAKVATRDIIDNQVLPRIGVVANDRTKIYYDYNSGRFMVWTPKEEAPAEPVDQQPVAASPEQPEQPQ